MQFKALCFFVVLGLAQCTADSTTLTSSSPVSEAERYLAEMWKYYDEAAARAKEPWDDFWSWMLCWLEEEQEKVESSSDVPQEAEEYLEELKDMWENMTAEIPARVAS